MKKFPGSIKKYLKILWFLVSTEVFFWWLNKEIMQINVTVNDSYCCCKKKKWFCRLCYLKNYFKGWKNCCANCCWIKKENGSKNDQIFTFSVPTNGTLVRYRLRFFYYTLDQVICILKQLPKRYLHKKNVYNLQLSLNLIKNYKHGFLVKIDKPEERMIILFVEIVKETLCTVNLITLKLYVP